MDPDAFACTTYLSCFRYRTSAYYYSVLFDNTTAIELDTPAVGDVPATSQSASKPTRKDVTVVDDGDIILALPKETFLRVSSVILSYASPVFKALLGPHFKEGQDVRSPTEPKKITLPEVDPSAMITLCAIVHFQGTGDEDLETSDFVRVVIVADKYACTQAVREPGEAYLLRWAIKPPASYPYLGDYCDLVVAAYLLRLDKLFALFTRRLILDQHTPFSELVGWRSCSMLPTIVFRTFV